MWRYWNCPSLQPAITLLISYKFRTSWLLEHPWWYWSWCGCRHCQWFGWLLCHTSVSTAPASSLLAPISSSMTFLSPPWLVIIRFFISKILMQHSRGKASMISTQNHRHISALVCLFLSFHVLLERACLSDPSISMHTDFHLCMNLERNAGSTDLRICKQFWTH